MSVRGTFRVTNTDIWSKRWFADLSPTAGHIYHWIYSNSRTDGACSSGLYHALLTDIQSGSHVRDQAVFEAAFAELTDSGIVIYDYENALLLDTRYVSDQIVNANQLKGALAYLGSLDPMPIVMEATRLVRAAFEKVMEPYRNPSDTLPPEPLPNPRKGHRRGKDRIEEERRGDKRKEDIGEKSVVDTQINALMTGFDGEEKGLVGLFLSLAASERKNGKIADTVRMRLVNELHQLKRDYPAEFKAGLTETMDRQIPNSNYVKAVIRGMGKRRQRTLNLWGAQKRRAEYDASRIAREKLDREHERNLEERKRRERIREEEDRKGRAEHGPAGEGSSRGGLPGHGRGDRPTSDRGADQSNRSAKEPAAARVGEKVGDGGGSAAVTEVSLSDYLGPQPGGAVHADGVRPGNGDEGRRALVPASGECGGPDG